MARLWPLVAALWWRSALGGKHGAAVARFVRDRRAEAHPDLQRPGSRPSHGKKLVIYRTHVADPLTLRLLRALSASLAEAEAYELCVLYDSDALPRAEAAFGGVAAKFVGLGLEKLLERYPRIKPRTVIVKSHYQQLAYAYAVDAVAKDGAAFDYVWGVEHDVGLTGGRWLALFEHHDTRDPRDLLAWHVGWTPRTDPVHGGGLWNAGSTYGPEFLRSSAKDAAFLFGSIVRYSGKFAAMLDEHARRPAPSYGHSEIAVPSICNATSWCTLGNLSSAWVGLNEYQLPVAITTRVFDALEALTPDRLFHPVRETASASSKADVERAAEGRRIEGPGAARANHTALCLLKNPRPPRPSYDCPIGCPHDRQRTCPTVNCIWGDPRGTYVHMAVNDCLAKCTRNPRGCPYDTSFGYVKDDGHQPF